MAAVAVQFAPKVLQAVRWQSLLRPISARLGVLLRAVYAGCLCSTILPLSGGELVRGALVAKETHTNLPEVLSTEVVERVVNAVVVIFFAWFALRNVILPQSLRTGQIVLVVAAAALVAALWVIVIRRGDLLAKLGQWRASNRLSTTVRSVALDLVRSIGGVRRRAMGLAGVASLGIAALEVATYWLMLRAYHLPLSGAQAAALFAIVTIGTSLPGAPGHVGSWQFFCAVGLQLFGVTSAQAAGFSLMGWVVLTIPPMIFGVIALLASSVKWSELAAIRPPAVTPGAVDDLADSK